jgi:3-oxoadipate enol-lactonase
VGTIVRAQVGGVGIGYQVDGTEGEWVLLITGLGYARWAWDWQVGQLSRSFRVITIDNRGIGESDAPPGPYTAAQMAADAAGVLENLGVGRALAIELALARPELVDRLVLCCTTFGGPRSLTMPEASVRLIAAAPSMPEEARLRAFVENALSERFARDQPNVIERIMALRVRTAQSQEAWQAQAAAGAAFDGADRVAGISAETLVVTGTEDRVVDPGNAKLLAEAISQATLAELPGGHLFMVEQADRFNALVGGFLRDGARAVAESGARKATG